MSIAALIQLAVVLLVLGIIYYIAIRIVDSFTMLEAPFALAIKAIIGLIIIVYLLGLLQGWAPGPVLWRR